MNGSNMDVRHQHCLGQSFSNTSRLATLLSTKLSSRLNNRLIHDAAFYQGSPHQVSWRNKYDRLSPQNSPYHLTQIWTLFWWYSIWSFQAGTWKGKIPKQEQLFAFMAQLQDTNGKIMVHKKTNCLMKCDVIPLLQFGYQSTHHWNEKKSTHQ